MDPCELLDRSIELAQHPDEEHVQFALSHSDPFLRTLVSDRRKYIADLQLVAAGERTRAAEEAFWRLERGVYRDGLVVWLESWREGIAERSTSPADPRLRRIDERLALLTKKREERPHAASG